MPRSLKALQQEKESLKGVSAGADSGKITVSATQPSDPVEGDEWFDKVNEVAYIAIENDTTSTVEFKSLSKGNTGSSIALTDFSTSTLGADNPSIVYNNVTGSFTYTPPSVPDVSGLALSSNIPTTLTDLGITDGTNGQLLSTNGSSNFSFATPSLNTSVTVYNTQASMPITGNSIGDMAFAEDTDRLFLWNNGWYLINFGSLINEAEPGGVLVTSLNTQTFTVPENVTSICVVCVGAGGGGGWYTTPDDASGGGGGGLAYANNIIVTPGQSFSVNVGVGGGTGGNGTPSWFDNSSVLYAGGGGGGVIDATTQPTAGGVGGTSSGSARNGGGNGGNGGQGHTSYAPGGGGGAGGYSGNGGTGADNLVDTSPVTGGIGAGGGGGGGSTENQDAGGGGGVGLYGEGASGTGGAGTVTGSGGGGGSGGANGSNGVNDGANGAGGLYGGGGAGGEAAAFTPGAGANGAVRIIWGNGRAFPSTNVSLADSTAGETTIQISNIMGRSLKTYKQEKAAIKGISGGGKKTTVSAVQPSNPIEGEIWYNESNEITYIAVENDTTSTIEWKEKSSAGGGGGIALTDLSIVTASEPSGNGALSYNNTTGVFTYTPPNVPSVAPYALSTSIPSTLTDLGITDGTNGQVLQTDGSGNFSFVTPQANGGAVTVYSQQDLFPETNNNIGDMAFAEDTDRLFFWNNGWYQIALINQNPSISGAESEYQLATDGTATVITLNVTDPEGFDTTIGYTTSGLTNQATVSQGTGANSNVFTITPSTNESNAGSFDITFSATDGINTAYFTSTLDLAFAAPPGGVLFDTVGTHSWIAPEGVTSVCVVAIGGGGAGLNTPSVSSGGGGLGWKNNIPVTPGQSYTVVVGRRGSRIGSDNLSTCNGGDSYFINTSTVKGGRGFPPTGLTGAGQFGGGGSYTGDGGGNGGDGTWGTGGTEPGGGGAGGYSGNGGRGGYGTGSANPFYSATAGSGGGGGGGSYGDYTAGGGGGVGVYGEGASGARGANPGTYSGSHGGNGGAGSGGQVGYYTTVNSGPNGTKGSSVSTNADGIAGSYGGGGYGRFGNSPNSYGGPGAVRIIWGTGRAFPSTNVDLASSTAGETTV